MNTEEQDPTLSLGWYIHPAGIAPEAALEMEAALEELLEDIPLEDQFLSTRNKVESNQHNETRS